MEDGLERKVELNCFKDILFDLINDWDRGAPEIIANGKENLFWVVMEDGSVLRIQCEKEAFHMFKPPA